MSDLHAVRITTRTGPRTAAPQRRTVFGLWALASLQLGGCIGLQQYHDKQPADTTSPEKLECRVGDSDLPDDTWKCADAYLENHDKYLLGFVEFDDLGWAWNKNQQASVIAAIESELEHRDALIVVFAHGWKHNAATCDNNVSCFRSTLEQLHDTEVALAGAGNARRIIGVYIGWRGDSSRGALLKQTTFFGRKDTAHKVGSGAVTELLVRLKEVRRKRHDMMQAGTSNTRLVVVGHSFGGALIFSATSQLFAERLAVSAAKQDEVYGFADLVVLVNPAFEAALYQPLHQAVIDRQEFPDEQRAILVIVTSEGDDATGKAFPIGRWFSAKLFSDYRTDDKKSFQRRANQTAIGHFEPFRTHILESRDTTPPLARPDKERDKDCLCPYILGGASMQAPQLEELRNDRKARKVTLKFPTSNLIWENGKGEQQTPYNSPLMVVSTAPTIIARHNDIYQPAFFDFLRYLIMLTGEEDAYATPPTEKSQ